MGARPVRPQPRRARRRDRRRARRRGRRATRRACCSPSNVARTYVQLARLVEQREVASALARAARRAARPDPPARRRPASTPPSSCARAKALLPETRQQLEALDEQIALARHALAALSVQPPNALRCARAALRRADAGRRARRAAGRPARPPRRHQRGALARRGGDARRRRGARAVLSEHQPDRVRRPVEPRPRPAAAQRQRAVRRRPGDPPADLRCRAAARQPARQAPPTSTLAIENYNGTVVDAVHDVADQIGSSAVARAPARASRPRRRPPPSSPTTSRRSATAPASAPTSPCSTPRPTCCAQRRLSADLRARALDTQVALMRALGGGYVPRRPRPRCSPNGPRWPSR